MKGEIRDDGTLDTVVACPLCGEEWRYTWDGEDGTYDEFKAWALKDFSEEHVCSDYGEDE